MRAWLVVLLFFGCAGTGAAQGLLVFNNRVGFEVDAPVYGVDPDNPAFAQYGAGVVYNGGLLAGGGFTAQIFGGPTNALVEELAATTPTTTFRTGDGAGFVVPPNRAVAIAGVPEGERAKVQLRVWNNRGGTITNWAQVLADPTVARGGSRPILTPPLGSVFIAPPNLIGLESFSLFLQIRLTSPRRPASGSFQCDYINPTGIAYCIQASEDLRQWSSAGTIAPGSGIYTDSGAANQSRRFYRVMRCN